MNWLLSGGWVGRLGRGPSPVRIRVRLGRRPKRLVDLDQDLLLPLGEMRLAQDGGDQVAGLLIGVVEDAGAQVQRLGADPQRLGDVLEDLGGGLAQPPLDLRQVGVGDACLPGQVAQ